MPHRIIHVLLVEDNPTDALVIREELAPAAGVSFVVTQAERLGEALQRLKDQPCDVVLLDLNLPDSNGFATFARLREAAAVVPIIIVTENAEAELALKAVQAGAQDYVVKRNLNERLLPRTIRYAMERKRSVEALALAHVQLRQLLDHSPAVIYAWKIEGAKFMPHLVSENIAPLLGFKPSEVMSYDWWLGHLHPADLEPAVASIAETLAQATSHTEYRLQHKDGTYRWVDDNRRLVRSAAGQPTELVGIWTDITERKRTEESLRLLSSAVEQSKESILITDAELDLPGPRILFVNPAFTQMTGYTAEEAIGRTPRMLQGPRTDAAVMRRLREYLSRGEVFAGQAVNYRKDGTAFQVEWQAAPIRNPAGVVTHFVAIQRDITKRMQDEELLRRNEAEQRQLAERLVAAQAVGKVGSWETDLVTREVIWSAETHRIFETSPDTFGPTHQRFLALVHPDDRAAVDLAFNRILLPDQPGVIEHRVVLAGGRSKTIEERWRVFYDAHGVALRAVGTCQDITERRAMDESLRASEELFRQVVENIHEVLWLKDVKSKQKLYISPSYEAIWGRTCASLYAAPDTWISTIHELDRDRMLRVAGNPAPEGGYDEIYRIVRPDGSVRWVHDQAFPIRDEAGVVYRVVGVAEDITERKQLEEQSLRAQRLENIGLLAAGISHDLNNVLAPIGMAVSLLRNHVTSSSDLRLLDILEKCGERGAGLVRLILGFAQGAGGEPRLVQVKHLLHDISGIITQTFPKSILLREDVPNDLWPVMANLTQIHQVLLNLCVNARDAMPSGGTIQLRAANCRLDAAAARAIEGAAPGAWLMLQVSDSGTGITPEVLARIWEPFFTTKAAGQGTGLGLSTVRGIVETCRGFTTIETEVGRGTTVRVYLPAEHSSGDPQGTLAPSAASRGQGELILLVDDERSIREIARDTLRHAGYRVVVAADGAEAIRVYEAQRAEIALVITDLDMPLIEGAALATFLRGKNPALKILAMSGSSSRSTQEKPCEFASAFMAKPFTVEQLLRHVGQLLHRDPAHIPTEVSWPAS